MTLIPSAGKSEDLMVPTLVGGFPHSACAGIGRIEFQITLKPRPTRDPQAFALGIKRLPEVVLGNSFLRPNSSGDAITTPRSQEAAGIASTESGQVQRPLAVFRTRPSPGAKRSRVQTTAFRTGQVAPAIHVPST